MFQQANHQRSQKRWIGLAVIVVVLSAAFFTYRQMTNSGYSFQDLFAVDTSSTRQVLPASERSRIYARAFPENGSKYFRGADAAGKLDASTDDAVQGIRRIADGLALLLASTGLSDESINRSFQEIRDRATAIERSPVSSQDSRDVREASLTICQLIARVESSRNELADSTNGKLAAAAERIDAARPLSAQLDRIREFFAQADDVVRELSRGLVD